MNVLLTSSGRRVALLESFRRAVAATGGGAVYAADMDPTAPTLQVADRPFALPPVHSSAYVPRLLGIARDEGVDLIVPLIDPELPVLARHQDLFRRYGITVMVSSRESVKIADDKLATATFLGEAGVPTPPTIDASDTGVAAIAAELGFPLVLKPRRGSSGAGVTICRDEEELAFRVKREGGLVAQAFVGGSEVTIDVFGDGAGNVLSLVPRKRLKVRGGEVERAVTIDDGYFREHVFRIADRFKPLGAINIQCHVTPGGPVFTEINARFGGGYPLADEAGAGFPELLVELVSGRHPSGCLGRYRRGLVMSRYDAAVYADVSRLAGGLELMRLSCDGQ